MGLVWQSIEDLAAADRFIVVVQPMPRFKIAKRVSDLFVNTVNLAPICGADPYTVIMTGVNWSSCINGGGVGRVSYRWRPTGWRVLGTIEAYEAAIWPIVPQLPVDQWALATC